MKAALRTPLRDAIDRDAYEYLTAHAPLYLEAIEDELAAGRSPEQIRHIMLTELGPDRVGLALRCTQAARFIKRTAERG